MVKKFLIQSENSVSAPVHDFGFHLLQAIKQQNWYRGNNELQYYLCNRAIQFNDKYIPIGSVEFVHSYLDWFHYPIPTPINIPKQLQSILFTGRDIHIGNIQDIYECSFVKSNTKIKGFTGIIDPAEPRLPELIDDEYLISEIIDIESEWRGFVHSGKLLDIRNYSGDPLVFPDIVAVGEMVNAWSDAPIAYTIDVAVTLRNYRRTTVLIECHNFYSCGLYGFQDYKKLPVMFSQWWHEYITRNPPIK